MLSSPVRQRKISLLTQVDMIEETHYARDHARLHGALVEALQKTDCRQFLSESIEFPIVEHFLQVLRPLELTRLATYKLKLTYGEEAALDASATEVSKTTQGEIW